MEFDWDPAKAASNLRKHGVSFELAATVFKDLLATSIPDEDHGAFEEREVTMGASWDSRLLVVSHTITDEDDAETLVRIISARPPPVESDDNTSLKHEDRVRFLERSTWKVLHR